MVFFTCNTCNESLKKNQVEKHLFKCRRCESLSCVDCGKDFWGDAYAEHTKCISEEEKYSGKGYVPKANANKGEKKQEAWVEQVQGAIDKAKANPKLKDVLLKIKNCSNIPRKKAKFENFLKNSMRIYDFSLITESWNLIQAGTDVPKPTTTPQPTSNGSVTNGNHGLLSEPSTGSIDSKENSEIPSEPKLNKRERKEERQRKNSKKDKTNKSEDLEDDETSKKKKKKKEKIAEEDPEESDHKKKKSKKRKHQEEVTEEEETVSKAKKSKTEDLSNEDSFENENWHNDSIMEEGCSVVKFRWEETILKCLQSANDNELSMKKLRKKVISEYWSNGGDSKLKSEEKVIAKFNKKVIKNPKLKIVKDRVKLVS